jgi:hypothetical protein
VYLLDVEPLDLGADVRAVGVELVEADENREPVRGMDAARIWSQVLRAVSATESWGLDFFSHLERLREYCKTHQISYREPNAHCVVIPEPRASALEGLLDRFQKETFGVRAGGPVQTEDPAVEGELARRGVDAYHKAFPRYYLCGICGFEDGSLILLSEKLWASEVIRRVRPVLDGLNVEVQLPA